MNDLARGMVVPFFVFLCPMVWYINRNLTSDVLPPRVEPSPELLLAALAAAVASAAVLAAVLVVLDRRVFADPSDDRRRLVLEPDDRTLAVFLAEISLLLLWAVPGLAGIGPALLEVALAPLAVLFGLPLFVVLPLALEASPGAHGVFVLALMAVPVWMAFLARIVADHLAPLT